MLLTGLLHGPLLAALASAGHGSGILLADGNFPVSTGVRAGVPVIALNLAPGLLSVEQVLAPLLQTVPVQAAAVMAADDGRPIPAHATFAARLGAELPLEQLDRASFYAAARAPELAVVIVTADQAEYANLLLTVGVRPAG